MTTPGATEAVTPPTPEELAYALYDAVRHMRPAEARAEIAKQLREAEVNALRRALDLCDISISYFRDGAAMSARVPKGERDCAAVALDDLKKAIRSLLPKEEGK